MGGSMNTIVVYYSNTGNNRYLAKKIAEDIQCEILEISPRVKTLYGLIISSLLKVSFGIHTIKKNMQDYDIVILCGPIWMGQFISPLSDFLKKYGNDIKKLYFASCCGSGSTSSETKFGYSKVFQQVNNLMYGKLALAEAFSIELITPEDMKGKDEETMKLRLSDENFKGEILKKYSEFINKIE